MRNRILFCNIAYMQYYDYEVIEEKPKHGGLYVSATGDALEKNNFHVCEDGKLRGFVETKYRDSYSSAKLPNSIRIENIDPCHKNKNSIDNVTVVFCAYSDELKSTVIVGWYKNATVLRQRETYKERQFNLICDSANGTLLKISDRKFIVPRARGGTFGFGQANLWYAKEDRAAHYVEDVMEYIAKNVAVSTNGEDIMPQIIPSLYEESGIGKKVLVNRYERNPQARTRCLELRGSQCAICGFDSSLVYGTDFKDKIEVHHIIPVNEIKADYQVDPERDLIPVCPNCHMILHTKMTNGEYPTIEYLKDIMKSKNKQIEESRQIHE